MIRVVLLDIFANTPGMAKQKFRPTRLGVFSGTKAYISYVEVLKNIITQPGGLFATPLILGLVSPQHFFQEFRDSRIFLPAVRAMNLTTTAHAAAAAFFPEHLGGQFMVAEGAFHERIPVSNRNLLSDQPTPKAMPVTRKKIVVRVCCVCRGLLLRILLY